MPASYLPAFYFHKIILKVTMIPFVSAVFFLIITPGPAVLALAGVGASFSFNQGIKFLLGVAIGHILVSLLVISGLITIVFSVPHMRTVFLFLSTIFLLYLAIKIFIQGSSISLPNYLAAPNTIEGIFLQLINPKAYAVHTIIFSGFSIFPENFIYETIWKFVVMNAIWFPIHFAWLAAGSNIKKIAIRPSTQKIINITMGNLLLLTVILSFVSLSA